MVGEKYSRLQLNVCKSIKCSKIVREVIIRKITTNVVHFYFEKDGKSISKLN